MISSLPLVLSWRRRPGLSDETLIFPRQTNTLSFQTILVRKPPLTSEGHSVAVVCWFESILALSERSKVHLARSQQTAALGHSPSLKMPQDLGSDCAFLDRAVARLLL